MAIEPDIDEALTMTPRCFSAKIGQTTLETIRIEPRLSARR
jgi:hypothetical protein